MQAQAQDEDSDGAQNGHALTAAYSFDATSHWRVSLEWLQVVSYSYNRADLYALSPWATQTQVQLAVRYALGSQIR